MKASSRLSHPRSLSLKAPAKINWFLKVFGLRNDGYHEIKSLIQKVTLYDLLEFSISDGLLLKTDMDISSDKNLVYQTAKLLKDIYRVDKGVTIQLKKHIPVAAGLGGGSSDSAATLVGLNRLWLLGLSLDELSSVAERCGSDVPFFLRGAMAFVEGRGERVMESSPNKPYHLLLVKPDLEIQTRWAYSALSRLRADKLTKKDNTVDNIDDFINCIRNGDIDGISRYNSIVLNDLERASLRAFPVIGEIKRRLLKEGAAFSLMSGSGPTVFGVFGSVEEAQRAERSFKDCWTAVVRTIVR